MENKKPKKYKPQTTELKYAGIVDAETGQLAIYRLAEMKMEARKYFKGKKIMLLITEWEEKKSLEQLGYLFGVIYKTALQGFKAKGNHLMTLEAARFIVEKESPALNIPFEMDGKLHHWQMGVSGANKKQLSLHIEHCINYIEVNFQLEVPDPKDYFRGKPKPINEIKTYK